MTSLEVTVGRHEERIENLEGAIDKQNGRLERIEAKLDRLHLWLIGLLGGVIASLGLLIINLVVRR